MVVALTVSYHEQILSNLSLIDLAIVCRSVGFL
jgi:hypothetical protein